MCFLVNFIPLCALVKKKDDTAVDSISSQRATPLAADCYWLGNLGATPGAAYRLVAVRIETLHVVGKSSRRDELIDMQPKMNSDI
jgi:hypothetical protein